MSAPKTNNPFVPSVEVSINGNALSTDDASRIVGVTVDDSVELPSMFTIDFVGGGDKGSSSPLVDDDTLFVIGNSVEIKMGYAGKLDSLFIGEITGLEPEFTATGQSGLILRGYDRRHRLLRGRKTRTFVQQKASDIASQIANEAGLTPQVEDSQVVHDYLVQANQSDLSFLQERAALMGFEVVVNDKTLIFRPEKNAESEVMTLTLEDDLLEFYPRLAIVQQVGEVDVRGWSIKDKQAVIGQGKTGDETSTMGGQDTGPKTGDGAFGAAIDLLNAAPVQAQAEADQIARARFNDIGLSFIKAEGVSLGRTDIRAGKVIKIDKIGKRFSGNYYITSAIHKYGDTGYRTEFIGRRNAS